METGEHQENWMITNRIKQKRIMRQGQLQENRNDREAGQNLKTSIGSKDKYRIKRQGHN
jgi:hypothetical protein